MHSKLNKLQKPLSQKLYVLTVASLGGKGSIRLIIPYSQRCVTPRNFELGPLVLQSNLIRMKLFDLCLYVRVSVVITIASEPKELRCLSLYQRYADRYCKGAISVHSIWYLKYKSNRYTMVFGTRKVRFTRNLILRLVY